MNNTTYYIEYNFTLTKLNKSDKKRQFFETYILYIYVRDKQKRDKIMTTTYDAIERNKKPAGALEIPADFHLYYLKKQDRQMRFNNGGDPIYAIFDKIDSRPLSKITKDFFRELADDSIRFISTLVK